VYLVGSGTGWTLVDAGWPGDGPRLEAAVATLIGATSPQGIALTHLHPDHEGDARVLADRWGCPVWVSPGELPVALRDFEHMRATAMPLDRWLVLPAMRLLGPERRRRIFAARTLQPVVRAFDPAEAVPGLPDWVWVPTPGHTPGHVSLFRPSDGVFLAGDALVTTRIDTLAHLLTRRRGLSEPPWYTTWDLGAARRSIQRVADLAPRVLGTGHGRPMTGPGTAQAVRELAARSSG
jgi:glyoxylase-like metal-dependent hydrolase (beta-lactamase superfamily II)